MAPSPLAAPLRSGCVFNPFFALSPALRFLFCLAIASPLLSSHSQCVFHHDNGLCIPYAYPEAVDVSENESDGEQADFDIDSDSSDVDLLGLKQDLNKLSPEKA